MKTVRRYAWQPTTAHVTASARSFPADGPRVEYLRFTVRTGTTPRRLIDAPERNVA